MNYQQKYHKYKQKYQQLRQLHWAGASQLDSPQPMETKPLTFSPPIELNTSPPGSSDMSEIDRLTEQMRGLSVSKPYVQVYLPEDTFQRNLTTIFNRRDCCPCVFRALGLIDDNMYHHLSHHLRDGYSQELMEQTWNHHHPNFRFSFAGIPGMEDPRRQHEILTDVYDNIMPSYGVIVGIQRQDGTRHCVIMCKDNRRQPMLIDAQACRNQLRAPDGTLQQCVFVGEQGVSQYFAQEHVVQLHILEGSSSGGVKKTLIIRPTTQS